MYPMISQLPHFSSALLWSQTLLGPGHYGVVALQFLPQRALLLQRPSASLLAQARAPARDQMFAWSVEPLDAGTKQFADSFHPSKAASCNRRDMGRWDAQHPKQPMGDLFIFNDITIDTIEYVYLYSILQ